MLMIISHLLSLDLPAAHRSNSESEKPAGKYRENLRERRRIESPLEADFLRPPVDQGLPHQRLPRGFGS